MAVTRLGLSGTPRAALTAATAAVVVAANLAQWAWTPLQAGVAADKTVSANLAQWEWTQNAATADVSRSIAANLAQWEWTPLAGNVSLAANIQAALAQWDWTTYQATVNTVAAELSVNANLASWQWTGLRANVAGGEVQATGGWEIRAPARKKRQKPKRDIYEVDEASQAATRRERRVELGLEPRTELEAPQEAPEAAEATQEAPGPVTPPTRLATLTLGYEPALGPEERARLLDALEQGFAEEDDEAAQRRRRLAALLIMLAA